MEIRKWKQQPFISILLIVVNTFCFFVDKVTGNQINILANLNVLSVMRDGEYWRIITSFFIHWDFPHLLNNMVMLFLLGTMMEEKLGHIAYTCLYFLSGVGGSLLSLFYKIYTLRFSNSLGASGAIFGLDGVLLAMALFLPDYRKVMDPRRVLLMIVLSLYGGFSGNNIDNAAHLGGLLSGFLFGSIVCLWKRVRRRGNGRFEY